MSFAFAASIASSIVKSKLGGGTKSKIPTMKTPAIRSVKSISDMKARRTSPTVSSATLNIPKQIATLSMFGQKSGITRNLSTRGI